MRKKISTRFFVLILLLAFGISSHSDEVSVSGGAKDNSFSQQEVRQSVEDTLELLNEVYVYPDKAKEVQIEITRRMNTGAYDHIKTKQEFASVFGSELRSISKDGHLGIMLAKDDKEKPTHVLEETQDDRKYNFGFQKIEVLAGNIGYMKFNKFYQDEAAKKTVDHAFGFLANTDAMILDLRDCIGGSPELARYMLSYFFDEETLLWSVYDRNNQSVGDHLSIEGVGSQKFKSDFPVFILTGPDTASAAELFAYTLKHFGKAEIVGENSAGVAHLVGAEIINEYFVGRFSVARPVNPVTKSSWEGVGVLPDIPASLSESLEAAHSEALK